MTLGSEVRWPTRHIADLREQVFVSEISKLGYGTDSSWVLEEIVSPEILFWYCRKGLGRQTNRKCRIFGPMGTVDLRYF